METKKLNMENISEAVTFLKDGKLVAFPTETVYGLGASALNEEAVREVFRAKGRPSDNPLIVHIADSSMISEYVDNLSEKACLLMSTFWPGPLTIILSLKPDVLSANVTGGLMTAAFRMPDNEATLELIRKCGFPLVGPSANSSGKPSPTTAEHVLHDLDGKISAVLDDGSTSIGIESTVIDLSDLSGIPTILRPGWITPAELSDVIGEVRLDDSLHDQMAVPKSPGMKYKHYSPKTPVVMVGDSEEAWKNAIEWVIDNQLDVGLLAQQRLLDTYDNAAKKTYQLSIDRNIQEASHHLFNGLRTLDESGNLDYILVQTYPEDGKSMGYMNRLKKAANRFIFSSKKGEPIQL